MEALGLSFCSCVGVFTGPGCHESNRQGSEQQTCFAVPEAGSPRAGTVD